ncbi:MarR family transcriptional regulator [Chloroflexia bacterium SDU3-3]|nr:MarR family transcriptional regulator [Chloroflexia bacterium SDU3-3]
MNDEISYQIIMLAHSHRQRCEENLKKIGLYAAQEHILFLLHEEDGLTATQLAARFRVGLATIGKSLQRMERAGLVVRRPDPEDRRALQVFLTEEGRALYAPAQQVWQDLAACTVRGMSDVEKVLFLRLLQQSVANLGEE